MATKKEEQNFDSLKSVENVLGKSEMFIEKYQKQILYVVGGIILIVLLILAFRNWYLVPREEQAELKLSVCQQYFAVDSFRIALNGNGTGNCIGFRGVIDEYGLTRSSKLANAYAGICYYHLGDYNAAINYLGKFDGKDSNIYPATIGMIGDCYVELGKTDEAVHYFLKAAKTADNEAISPIYLKKAGVAYEALKQYDKAIDAYQQIKDNYFKSQEAMDIDRYIGRAQTLKK